MQLKAAPKLGRGLLTIGPFERNWLGECGSVAMLVRRASGALIGAPVLGPGDVETLRAGVAVDLLMDVGALLFFPLQVCVIGKQ